MESSLKERTKAVEYLSDRYCFCLAAGKAIGSMNKMAVLDPCVKFAGWQVEGLSSLARTAVTEKMGFVSVDLLSVKECFQGLLKGNTIDSNGVEVNFGTSLLNLVKGNLGIELIKTYKSENSVKGVFCKIKAELADASYRITSVTKSPTWVKTSNLLIDKETHSVNIEYKLWITFYLVEMIGKFPKWVTFSLIACKFFAPQKFELDLGTSSFA